jgi:hypothetical protein|tara:strand:+ start:578 stop:733 length:156 start_codon:yes stop_codon:yes gene_type:complete
MKSKFIKEGKEILYIDKKGRKWDKECLDELFDAISKRRGIEETIDYYTYES